MAQPASRTDLINYCKRQLGAPVLEINVADEQVDDLVDDALQYFHERHFDGVEQTYLKYKITQADIDRGRGRGGDNPVGIVTTSAETTIVGTATTFSYEENSNYLQVPPAVIGINKIFKFDGSNTVTNNMFSVKYQLFLNDIYTLFIRVIDPYIQRFQLPNQKNVYKCICIDLTHSVYYPPGHKN